MRFPHVIRSFLATSALAAAVGLASCSTTEDFWAPMNELVDHESPVIAAPSQVGAVIGGIAGVPVAIAALPITVPIAAATANGDGVNLLPLSPLFAVSQLGAIVIGGPVWLVTGGGSWLPGGGD